MQSQLTPNRRTRQSVWILAAVTLLSAAVSCGARITSGAPVTPSGPPALPVNVSLLDPGRFPTTPQPEAGATGSEQAGRLAEGHRIVNYTVGAWQVDPDLTDYLAGDVAVVDTQKELGKVMWAWLTAGARDRALLAGFTSERRSTHGPRKSLRNAVLRFADDGTASAVAQAFHDQAMSFPHVEDIMPVVTEPEQDTPIPGHPDSHGALITYQQADERMQELIVATARGPFVLFQVIHCAATPECPAQLAARTLDLQQPLIDTFAAADPAQFSAMPADPTGLVARTLPLPPSETTSTTGAAYTPSGALHFEHNPVALAPALDAAHVDEVAINRATIYQAGTPEAARKLQETYRGILSAVRSNQAAAAVPGMPQSSCVLVPGTGGIIPHYWCLATAGRFMLKTIARQIDTAHQEMAAQYRILNP